MYLLAMRLQPDDARRVVHPPMVRKNLLTTVIYYGAVLRERDVRDSVLSDGVAGLCPGRRGRPAWHDYGTKFLVAAGIAERARGWWTSTRIASGQKDLAQENSACRQLNLKLSHFEASLLFALVHPRSLLRRGDLSRTGPQRMRYATYCFAWFVAASIFGLSWLMYLGHG